MIKEFCAENLSKVPSAIAAGASRIELCDDLSIGGITPKLDVIKQAAIIQKETSVPFMVMVRTRGGNFVYNKNEIAEMKKVISQVKENGLAGVVFGCLTDQNLLDEPTLIDLAEQSKGLDVTFHMAFDEIPISEQRKALEWLGSHGYHRVLTHGGSLKEPIDNMIPHLQELIRFGKEVGVTVMPGGGITTANIESVLAKLGVKEIHGTRIVNI